MERHILRPGPNDCGKRIDRILRVCFPAAGLGALFAALRRGEISVNGKKVSQNYRVAEGDQISVKKTFLPRETPLARSLPHQAAGGFFNKYIVFEDENFLALNKPWGRLSHGPGSLAEEAAAYLAPFLPPSLSFSPGPLHRLDRNTTGLIFFSKSLEGARAFSAALRAGSIRKTY
ncbi:MAG: pseudouridine synthase, partial [Spirochaetaceae bacterium]|nr:pseudouridine synthase [Spirochaetaceae bacterium]